MNQPHHNPPDDAARRKAVRRTALWVGAVAVAIYLIFIFSGVLGK